jgi:hypothetical protein
MKYSLLLLPLLASLATAQDDPWKSLKKGDRVQVTFRSGNTILGRLASKPADPRVPAGTIDYSAIAEITIDVSLEYPGLNGTMTIPKKEIREIRKLGNLDAASMKKIQEEMERIQKQTAADEQARKSAEGDRDKAAQVAREAADKKKQDEEGDKEKGAQLLKDFEDLQKAKEILARFPPDKYGPQTLKDMADMAVRKQPIPLDIREFADPEVQRLWNLGASAAKKEKTEEKKEKVEEKKQ